MESSEDLILTLTIYLICVQLARCQAQLQKIEERTHPVLCLRTGTLYVARNSSFVFLFHFLLFFPCIELR
jgi:hypothetical protein